MTADRGLYDKFEVTQDGEPLPDRVFVLRPERDLVARKALRLYADLTPNTPLAGDLYAWLRDDR